MSTLREPSSYGADFRLTLFTDDPGLALCAEEAGIDRIGSDLERLGKSERQGGQGTWLSDHRAECLYDLRMVLSQAKLFARTNPVHPGSREEIEALLEAGTEVLMLPMFRCAREVEQFVDLVAGRATVVLLLETAAAAFRVDEIVQVPGVDEIHIGLNDLRLDTGLFNHFEVLGSDLLDRICTAVLEAGLPLGVGGVGRADDRNLPIPANLVHAQLPRLGATGALISRVFLRSRVPEVQLQADVAALRSALDGWSRQSSARLASRREELRHLVRRLRDGEPQHTSHG